MPEKRNYLKEYGVLALVAAVGGALGSLIDNIGFIADFLTAAGPVGATLSASVPGVVISLLELARREFLNIKW